MSEFERLERDFGWKISKFANFRDGVWVAGSREDLSYPNESRNALAEIESSSFWFLHRNKIIKRLLRSCPHVNAIWEIGSGNGFVSWHLQQAGLEAVAVEPGHDGAVIAARRGVKNSISATLEDLHLPNDSLSAVGLFDVLEHLENPRTLLDECSRVLKPGGYALVTVPAFPSLWSQADVDAGHFRRYRHASLTYEMEVAGFIPIATTYMMLTTWLPLWLLRSLPFKLGRRCPKEMKLKETIRQLSPNKGLSALLTLLFSIEFSVSSLLPLPFGTSVVGLYYKPITKDKV